MTYFFVEPEVAGGLGERTEMDRSVHPPIVTRLHYAFDGWLGDVLLETFPVFIVTDEARQSLRAAGSSGVAFGGVEVTTSELFAELYPDRTLPSFVWLKPEGRAGHDDFGTAADGRLVVSQSALELLTRLGIANAFVEPFADEAG